MIRISLVIVLKNNTLPAKTHQVGLSPPQCDPPDTLDDDATPVRMVVQVPSQHMGDLECP